jgi:hypothetical protein
MYSQKAETRQFAAIGAAFFGATVAPIVGGALGDTYGFSAPMLLASAGALLVFAISLGMRETLADRASSEKEERAA